MDFNVIMTALGQWGPAGVIIAVLMWQNSRIVNRLFSVIETNTQILTELKTVIENWTERSKK